MLDAKFVREHEEELRDTITRQKRADRMQILDTVLAKDKEWRSLKLDVDNLRKERNQLSKEVNEAKKSGQDPSEVLQKVKAVPEKIKQAEEQMQALQGELDGLLRQIPNIMHKDVPYGETDEDNPEVKRWGEPRSFDFPIKNHVELCEQLGLADFEASSHTTGNGFYYLKGDLALLNQALIQFAITLMRKKGYTYVEPPLMVRRQVIDAAMDSEAFEQSIYQVDDELALIGTAEHAILGMHANTVFQEETLPRKYFGYSMCFRKEIGSHGINEKGLWRTHQFNKVEQFLFCLPEQSGDLYEELYKNSEEILQSLELPYRVVEICTGDLAVWKARSHDFEVWRPTTKSYGEVMSLSNCTTYQANDLDIRYVRKNQERGVAHTLNNTALATSRIMVAILENYQNKDGSIAIPKALQPYMGKEVMHGN